MSELLNRVRALSPQQREALLARLKPPDADAAGPRGGLLAELSLHEERIWFLQSISPLSTAYNVAMAAELSGPLDVAALKAAVERLAVRHEALRTRYVTVAGRPTRVVDAEARYEFEVTDLAGDPSAVERARDLARATVNRPFALDRDALIRVCVVRRAPGLAVVALATHHIVSDGWSLGVLTRDLWALYQGLANGEPARLPPITRQYSEFAARQRQQRAAAGSGPVEFWQRELSLATRLDFGRRPAGGREGARTCSVSIEAAVQTALARFAKGEGATFFMLMAAAVSVVLGRYADDDFLLGFPSSNRLSEEFEHVVGLFANTLVVRIGRPGRQSPRQLLADVRRRVVQALDHELPFSDIVRAARLGDSEVMSPLIQAMCVVDDGPVPFGAPAGMTIRPFLIENGDPKFELAVTATPDASGLRCTFEYDAGLLEPEDVRRMADELRAVLTVMASNPDEPIADRLPRTAPVPASALPAAIPFEAVQDTIAAVAREQPSATAVISSDRQLTYAELQAQIDRVAGFVQLAVRRAGATVGVHLPRSVDAVVAILGILRAGCAYVPLAPAEPGARIRQLVGDARCALVFGPAEGDIAGTRVVTVAAALASTARAEPARVDPGQPAYVIYTSGTTGEPKGVMVSHGNLHASTSARRVEYESPVRRFAWVSPIVFDSSVAGLFWTLSVGGALVIPADDELIDPARLGRTIANTRATHLLCLPSLYAQVLRVVSAETLGSLEVVIVAGEACPADLWRMHRLRLPEAALYNEYGPTEATVWATVHRCSSEDGDVVPIGKAVHGAHLRILDRAGRPVAPGTVGELCIGGSGVALGYVGRPDSTAQRFVPDDLVAGGRLYRTGDLVSERADGVLDFHGRSDRQLKIRGSRIDPGEIEAHLATHPAVRSAAVVGRMAGGRTQLVAYVALERRGIVDAAALRAHLRQRLPDAFIPARYCLVEALPRTDSGKIDYAALGGLDDEPFPAGRAPSTPIERRIADAWSAVLGTPAVDVEANFFDVGGHSLLLMSLHASLAAHFPSLSIVDLLEHATIDEQARFLERQADGAERIRARPAGPPARRLDDLRRARRAARLPLD